MSHWSNTAYEALRQAQEACRKGNLDEAIRAADRATNLLLEARNARDNRWAKRDKAWEVFLALPRPRELDVTEQGWMRTGFNHAWELATGAGEVKDSPIQAVETHPGWTHQAIAAVRPVPIKGSERACQEWAGHVAGRNVWTEADNTHSGRLIGVVQSTSIIILTP